MYHSVSLENAATYDEDRHLRANFNDVSTKTKSFLTRLQSAWPGKKFQEIILDCKIGTMLLDILFGASTSNMVKRLLANISTYVLFFNISLTCIPRFLEPVLVGFRSLEVILFLHSTSGIRHQGSLRGRRHSVPAILSSLRV